ncbi:MAG: hypothetical protein HWQ38_24115 [Nostoc sp. NMS7]|uniref:hypothetical protein n=1 Tax=Nostoc sp. NMS7 TaxID=2815391 RepID=UPI0025D03F43|nr:hypothetical protein [Nostoc sp. NMS7]MBN3949379.1 hypothetical protein [Nostoc sp. NMS7]
MNINEPLIEASQNFIMKLHSTIDSMCAAYLSETGHSGFLIEEKYNLGLKYWVANHNEFPSLEVPTPDSLKLIEQTYLQRKNQEWRSLTDFLASQVEIVVESNSLQFMSFRIQQRGDLCGNPKEERP